jgi:hypothetical protein
MRASSSLLASSGMAIGVTAIAIAVMLLASNFTLINAQPQQVTSQPGEIENGTTTFQSTSDSFSIQVPSGWIIQDVDNAGPAQLEEVRQGYGILVQLCPEEQQGAAAAASNASGGSTNTISNINASRCQGAQEVIHIIRYPDLDNRLQPANNVTTTNNNLTTTDNILTYHLQKLQEVGYRSMQIVNSTDMTSNLRDPQTNETITTVPGKLVEMTYSTNFAPNEIKRGYFILTATNSTVPNVGTTKGYGVFYEGNSTTTTPAEITTAAASLPLPPQVGQVFDSFELIAAPGVAQALAEATEDDDDEDDNGADDEDDNGADDEDDNGADDEDDNGADDEDDNGADDEDDNGADDEDEDEDDNGADDEDEDEDDNGADGNGGDDNGEDDLEDCTVSPGGDPGDDCDFTPDDADADA